MDHDNLWMRRLWEIELETIKVEANLEIQKIQVKVDLHIQLLRMDMEILRFADDPAALRAMVAARALQPPPTTDIMAKSQAAISLIMEAAAAKSQARLRDINSIWNGRREEDEDEGSSSSLAGEDAEGAPQVAPQEEDALDVKAALAVEEDAPVADEEDASAGRIVYAHYLAQISENGAKIVRVFATQNEAAKAIGRTGSSLTTAIGKGWRSGPDRSLWRFYKNCDAALLATYDPASLPPPPRQVTCSKAVERRDAVSGEVTAVYNNIAAAVKATGACYKTINLYIKSGAPLHGSTWTLAGVEA